MLQSRLSSILRQELETAQLQISPYCLQQMEHLLGHGIKRMRMNKTLDHPGYALQAEQNLRALVKYFSDYSEKLGTFPSLSDNQFDTALRTCPTLWPYCSSG